MNKINILIIILLVFSISISCEDKDEWVPGPKSHTNNPGVYFDRNNPKVFEMEANTQLELIQDYFTIALGRDPDKISSALKVPIIVRNAGSNLSIPQTVEFTAGSSKAELKIHMTKYELGVFYNLSVEIDNNYANPYRIYEDDEEGGSSRLDCKIEVLSLLATATFTPKDYSGTNKPKFIPFTQKIYDNLDGSYSISNFLFNNAGYKFTFTLNEEKNILPIGSCGYHSKEDNRWFFYSANSSASINRLPCYIPGNDANDNITYIFFYTAENTEPYQAFWLDLEAKKGKMMGYSRYSVSSSGRIAFDISWK